MTNPSAPALLGRFRRGGGSRGRGGARHTLQLGREGVKRQRRALLGGGDGGLGRRLGLGLPWTETTGEKGGGRTGGAGGIDEVLLTSRGRVERRPLARHGASAMEHSEGGERGKERIAKRPLELLN